MQHLLLGALLTAHIHGHCNGNGSMGEIRCTEESTGAKCGLTSFQDHILLSLSYSQG